MWCKTHRRKVTNITVDEVWKTWEEVDKWHLWQDDIEYAKLDGKFEVGNSISLKPKGTDKVFTTTLVKVEPNKNFTDLTKFPLAKMYGIHEFKVMGSELELRTTIKVTGLLSFLWRKLIAEKIANDDPKQTNKLIEYILKNKS